MIHSIEAQLTSSFTCVRDYSNNLQRMSLFGKSISFQARTRGQMDAENEMVFILLFSTPLVGSQSETLSDTKFSNF